MKRLKEKVWGNSDFGMRIAECPARRATGGLPRRGADDEEDEHHYGGDEQDDVDAFLARRGVGVGFGRHIGKFGRNSECGI